MAPPLSPRNANYSIDARLDPASRTITGSELDHLAEHHRAGRRPICSFTCTGTRGGITRIDVHARAALARRRRTATARPDDWSRIDVTSIKLVAPAAPARAISRRRSTSSRPTTAIADDETVLAVPLPQPCRPGAAIDAGSEMDGARAADRSRAPARSATSSSSRSGSRSSACCRTRAGTAISSTRARNSSPTTASTTCSLTVPQGWTVGATGVERERRDNADGTDDAPVLPGRRPRLRLDDEPGLRRADGALRASDAAAGRRCGCCSSRSTRTRPIAISTRRARRSKYYGEWFGAYPYGHITIVDPAYQSGAGGMEYPTLFTAGTRWLAPAHVTTPEERDDPRSRPPVLVRHRRQQRVRRRVDGRRASTRSRPRARSRRSTIRTTTRTRYFGGFVPWVFKDIVDPPRDRRQPPRRLPARREDRRRSRRRRYRYFPATGGAITYNKTALWLNTMERWLGWPTLQRIMSTHFERWKFKHPKPDDFFAHRRTKSAGRDLTLVLRSGVPQLERVRLRRPGTDERRAKADTSAPTVVVRRYGEAIFPGRRAS